MAAPGLDDLSFRLTALEDAVRQQGEILHETRKVAREIRQLVGPFAVPVSPGELLVQTLFGVKFYIPANDQLITPQLVVYRQWEASLSRLIPYLAPAGSVFVDVGANFGYFTCLVAAGMRATPGSRVVAIEPNPYMLRLLDINTRINWSMAPVRVVPAAVADVRGAFLLAIPENQPGNASLVAIGSAPPSKPLGASNETTKINVDVLTLDDILCNERRVDLIKVDVEGFETAVFRGGSETLARPGLKIIFEWAPTQTVAAGFKPQMPLEILRSFGYVLYDAEKFLDTAAPRELSNEEILDIRYANILALRV